MLRGTVADLDAHRLRLTAHAHGDARAAGVAQHVRQALLHDVGDGVGDVGGEARLLALGPQRHVEAAARGTRDERLHDAGAGRGRSIVGEEPDEASHVALRLVGCAGDRLERLRGARRIIGDALSGAGLDHHDADGVRDDVVQVRGDARPFVAQRERRVRVVLLRELAPTLGELGRGEIAVAQRPARDPRRDEDDEPRHRSVVRKRDRELHRRGDRDERDAGGGAALGPARQKQVDGEQRRHAPGDAERRDR